nr:Cell division control protein 2 [Crypthecodinium cohnii]
METRFKIVEKLGEGTYGKVYKAIDNNTQEPYALKKIKIVYEADGEGVPGTAIREVSLLKECDHVNVIKLYEVFVQPTALYMLFEYADMDMRAYLKRFGKLADPVWLKSATCQLFCGISFCHRRRILHRDLKPQNVLVDVANSCLKLADFGLARAFSVPLRAYTHEVVTLWYRSPEVLLGQRKYATPMDIWSLGCIVAEMATAQALFPGDSEIDQIFKIFRVLGTPTEKVWPGLTTLQDFKQTFPRWHSTELRAVAEHGPGLGSAGLDVIRQCLRYNPVDRPSAQRMLEAHPFMQEACLDQPGTRSSPA